MSKRVYIGIGHGGKDPGACANGLRECDLALALGFLVQAEFQRCGVETKMSRTSDVTFGTDAKIADANAWGADVVIDLHLNSAGGEGFEAFHAPDVSGKKATDGSVELAAAINKTIAATGRKSRGIKPDTQSALGQLGIVRRTKAPAALLEYGFIDNTSDVKLITSPTHQQAWAEATVKGVLDYLDVAYTGPDEDVASLTPICGTAHATAAQMNAYLAAINPDAPLYGELYIEEGEKEGIRGDIAFAQSCLETGNWRFGNDVKAEQNNFCGLGATGGGDPGHRFATPREGIRAQIQHLKAYATKEPLAGDCIDPRFGLVTRGTAPYLEWLGQKENPAGVGWAMGAGYGGKIGGILEKILATEVEGDAGSDELAALRKEVERLQAENEQLENIIKDAAYILKVRITS